MIRFPHFLEHEQEVRGASGMDEPMNAYTDACATINASLEAVKALQVNFSAKVDTLEAEAKDLRSNLKREQREASDLRKRLESAEATAAAAKSEHAAYMAQVSAAEKESTALVSSLSQELAVSHATHEETKNNLVEERKRAAEAAKTSSDTVKELNTKCADVQRAMDVAKMEVENAHARAEDAMHAKREAAVGRAAAEKDAKAKLEALLASKEEVAELKALLTDKVAEEVAAHDLTRTQLDRLKQESFNLYTAYTQSMEKLEEYRHALEAESQESARLHEALARQKQQAAREAMRMSKSSSMMLPPSSIATMGLSSPAVGDNVDTPTPLRPLGKENNFTLDTIERKFAVVD